MLITALQDKKSFHDDIKENLRFKHSRLNRINNQKQNQKENIRLIVVSIGVDVVAKTDDEIYVFLSINKSFG